ncbi:MAG: glycosyltransferase family 4 protein [Verrucomicrobiaceae bacterium]|nr:glycosyltransferase family 4 protein [Verrucomicrobiaceae bacterium]
MRACAGDSMSRVLILVENLPVPLDRRVWQEAGALRDAGHQVTVVCPRMRGYDTSFEVLEGITIYRHWISGEARSKLGFFWEYLTALWGQWWCAVRAWRAGGFDVIHLCNPPDILFLVALPFKWLAGVKVVFDVHDLWPEMFAVKFGRCGPVHALVRVAERCTLKVADAVIATNESVRAKILERSAVPESAVTIVRTAPNDMDTAAAVDGSLKKGRTYLIGYIGVMGDADGVDFLIRAAHEIVVNQGRSDVQFLLMGTGPEFEALVQLRDELGLADYVTMPGRVSNEYLFTALQTMDVGVACDPINEYNDHCTMNKTLEYMAFGKPQVMFGTREGRFSAGDAAVYVMENSAASLAEAIVELLANRTARERMGREGRRRLAEDLSWNKSVVSLCAAYARLGS